MSTPVIKQTQSSIRGFAFQYFVNCILSRFISLITISCAPQTCIAAATKCQAFNYGKIYQNTKNK